MAPDMRCAVEEMESGWILLLPIIPNSSERTLDIWEMGRDGDVARDGQGVVIESFGLGDGGQMMVGITISEAGLGEGGVITYSLLGGFVALWLRSWVALASAARPLRWGHLIFMIGGTGPSKGMIGCGASLLVLSIAVRRAVTSESLAVADGVKRTCWEVLRGVLFFLFKVLFLVETEG